MCVAEASDVPHRRRRRYRHRVKSLKSLSLAQSAWRLNPMKEEGPTGCSLFCGGVDSCRSPFGKSNEGEPCQMEVTLTFALAGTGQEGRGKGRKGEGGESSRRTQIQATRLMVLRPTKASGAAAAAAAVLFTIERGCFSCRWKCGTSGEISRTERGLAEK